jgi:hypothetical protein
MLFLLLLLLNGIDCANRINWFSSDVLNDYTYQFYLNNSNIISGFYPCCTIFTLSPNGEIQQNYNDSIIHGFMDPYKNINITIIPVISNANKTRMYNTYKNVNKFVNQAIQYILKYKFDGFMIDYEADDDDINSFTNFLTIFADNLHKINAKVGVCLGSWGMLAKYNFYAKTNVDIFMNMATYDYNSMVYEYTNWLINNVTNEKAVSGIAFPSSPHNHVQPLTLDHGWLQSDLHQYLTYLKKLNVKQIDIWWHPHHPNEVIILDYYVSELNLFIN